MTLRDRLLRLVGLKPSTRAALRFLAESRDFYRFSAQIDPLRAGLLPRLRDAPTVRA